MSGVRAAADAELRVVLAGAEAGVDPGRLARRLGGAAELLAASPRRLAALGALPALVDALRRARRSDAAAVRRRLEAGGTRVLTLSEAAYPARLRELADPPLAVFARGRRTDALAWEEPVLAVVGARRAADAAVRLARELAAAAAGGGALVVSGLAHGVDAAAHRGALDAAAPTVAVLGCGVDVVYPRANAALFRSVERDGLLLAEYPPGTPAARWRFPARNRIIAALADAVLVVEAAERSGALITADHALDLGRDVLAVPGWPAFAGAAGVNGLLKAGAGLVEGPDDLLGWLGLPDRRPPAGAAPDPAGHAGVVLAALRDGPGVPDELGERTGLAPAEVAAALARLELGGLVARDASGRLVPAGGRMVAM